MESECSTDDTSRFFECAPTADIKYYYGIENHACDVLATDIQES